MSQVVIENPVVNSPFEEPERHFRFSDEGITNEIASERRPSSYFVPVPGPKKKGKRAQMVFDTQWTRDRIEPNRTINRIREQVAIWRQAGHPDVTRTTARLLEHWTSPDRNRRLFFCQIEALETIIYVTEVAKKYGHMWIDSDLRKFNEDANPGLYRIAVKMATGSGKTVVMAMLIAWHVLNKRANPQDKRFTDAFLVVTPGITIRDRLRVLLPNDPQNYYHVMDIVPPIRRRRRWWRCWRISKSAARSTCRPTRQPAASGTRPSRSALLTPAAASTHWSAPGTGTATLRDAAASLLLQWFLHGRR